MKRFATEIKWGIIITLALIASAIAEKEIGLYESPGFAYYLFSTLCFAPIGLLLYALFYREKKKDYFNGNMTWRQGFFAGMMLTAIIAVLVPLQKNIIHRGIAPELFENTIAQFTASGKRSRAEAEEIWNLSAVIYSGIQIVLSAGIVASALLSLAFRTKTK